MVSTQSLFFPVLLAAMLVAVGAFSAFQPKAQIRKQRSRNHESNSGGTDRANKLHFKSRVPKPLVRANLHKTVVLECEAAGSPPPTIHWLFNGSRIIQGVDNSIIDEEASYESTVTANKHISMLKLSSTISRLYVDCVTKADEGHYTCVADNPTQRVVTNTKLKIHRNVVGVEDGCLAKKDHEGIPARVYMWTVNRLEVEGAYVQLFCRAFGLPRPEITWLDRDDNLITRNSNDYRLLPNGDLLVKAITFDAKMGVYKCVARNEFGQDKQETFLYPAGGF
ncbi:zwei Ig domain protein zig-4-like [Lineus longissimus]|uniref:zwei Ig domain protein zig-4-like n=1 Tax=Lineus longissimus TaxID=88925 RepID=UPI002B4E653E